MPGSDRRDLTETYHNFASHLQPGAALSNRYKIVKLLGIGGMGRVYLARDEELNIDVALKLIRPELLGDDLAIDRFKNELILARKVSHKNIARIHDLGEIDGLRFLTMSYIAGKTLRDIIRDTGPLPVDRAVSIFTQVVQGVAAAHDEEVIHRDLKPANILVDETDRVFVTDFGIARSLDAVDHTGAGLLLGTPAYLSPEQTWGEKADMRSDIYALGLVLYEMLTGHLPFDHTTAHAFRTKLPPDLDSKVRKTQPLMPPFLIGILRKCLHPNRELRYPNVNALLKDLTARQSSAAFTFPWRPVAAIVALLALAAGAFVWRDRWLPSTQPPMDGVATQQRSRSVLVLPFLNRTSDEKLQWTGPGMTDMLIGDLSQDPNVRVVSSERLFQTMEDLKVRSSDLSAEDLKRLSEILNADWIVQGSLVQAGKGLRADMKLMERNESANPVYLKAEAKSNEEILQLSVDLAKQLQQHWNSGEAISSKPETRSVAALEAFQNGMNFMRGGEFDRAATSFESAVRADPQYARAYLKWSEAQDAAGQFDSAVQALEQGLKSTEPSRGRELLLAQHALLQGDLDKAIELYGNVTKKYPNDSEALFHLALACEDAGDLKQAVEALEKLVAIDPNHPEAYFNLGKDTILMGQADKAIHQHLVKALSIHRRLNNKYGEADVLNAFGVGYERLGHYDEAIQNYQNSILIKEQVGNRKGTATSLSNIAKIYIFQGEHEKARDYLGKARTIFEQLEDRKGIADATNQFGVISEDQGQYAEALAHYKKALQIRKDLGNDQQTAQSYDNIGHIYYLQGKYDDAQVFWEQALALRRSIGEEAGIILSLQNIGFLQTAQGQLDGAIKSFMESLKQARALQYENAIAVSLGNLGTIHFMQGRYQAALDSFGEAVTVLEKLKDKKGIAEYKKMAGIVHLELNDYEAALQTLNASLKNAEDAKTADIVADTQILLARAYRMQKQTDKSDALLRSAMQTAKDREFKKTLLRGTVELGWLQMEKDQDPAESLRAARDAASEQRDPWLELQLSEALIAAEVKRGKPDRAVAESSVALALARKLNSQPFLYRLHLNVSKAYQSLKNDKQAKQHLSQAEMARDELKKMSPLLAARL